MHAASSSLVRPSCGTLSLPWRIRQDQCLRGLQVQQITKAVCEHSRCKDDGYRITGNSSRDACLVTAPVAPQHSSRSSDAAADQGGRGKGSQGQATSATEIGGGQPTAGGRYDGNTAGNNILPMASATAASSVTVYVAEGETDQHPQPRRVSHEHDVQHGQQRSQLATAGTANQLPTSLWLPDNQLWVPHSSLGGEDAHLQTAAVASSTPCEEASTSGRPRTLSRVYMAAAAVSGSFGSACCNVDEVCTSAYRICCAECQHIVSHTTSGSTASSHPNISK